MSSVAAAYSQVPVRAKYLQARAATYEYVPSTTVPPTAVSKTARTYVGTAPQTEFVNAGEVFASAAQGSANTMYRDKGKRVTLVDTAGKHVATLALVAQYNPETGGSTSAATNQGTVAGSGQVYVQVWDAFNPLNVTVVAGPA